MGPSQLFLCELTVAVQHEGYCLPQVDASFLQGSGLRVGTGKFLNKGNKSFWYLAIHSRQADSHSKLHAAGDS